MIDPPHTVQFVSGVSKSVVELHNSVFAALHRLCGYRPHNIEAGGLRMGLQSPQPRHSLIAVTRS